MVKGSVITNSSVNYTGSGKLRGIVVNDTSDVNGALDASISINIDGAGAVALSLNNFVQGVAASGGPETTSPSIKSSTDVFNLLSTKDPGASNEGAYHLDLDLYFTSSLVITITNADSYVIAYDKDVF